MDKKKVLFVCVHNSGRSQMAEAFFNYLAAENASASSAGTQPAPEINPTVVRVMREVGLDVSRKKPKMITFQMMKSADRVITMGCGAEKVCPASFVPAEDWQIEDPEGKAIGEVREIRDIIRKKVQALIEEINVAPSKNSGSGLNQPESHSVSIELKRDEKWKISL
ncbi:MAG: arsenate reductase ArsC [Dehalococcoidales bacterium]